MGNIMKNKGLSKLLVFLTVVITISVLVFVGSEAAFAFSPEYVNWTEHPLNPVFQPFIMSVQQHYVVFDGSGYKMWWIGSGGPLFYTTSPDGDVWASSVSITGLPMISSFMMQQVGSGYRIWYSSSVFTSTMANIYTADSSNGLTWNTPNPCTQYLTSVLSTSPGNWNSNIMSPYKVFYNSSGSASITAPVNASTVWANKYVMYYGGTASPGSGVIGVGIAVSANGSDWRGLNYGVSPVMTGGASAWDEYIMTASILKISGQYHMWYSANPSVIFSLGQGIGYAQSTDGITWTKYVSNPIMDISDVTPNPWRTGTVNSPQVLYDSNNFSGYGENSALKMWYSGNTFLGVAWDTTNVSPPTTTTTSTTTSSSTTSGPPTTGGGGPIGGIVSPVDKSAVLMPYLYGLVGVVIVTVGGFVWRRIYINRESNRKN